MYRMAMENLLAWKQSRRRKPLIIEGARQVGKTWLMKEFGRQAYGDTAVYINFLIPMPEWQSCLLRIWIQSAWSWGWSCTQAGKLTRKMHC